MCNSIDTPLVSIVCNTFNHVDYIRQCLDGFLMQETNFSIEILVHDDASSDGTAEIVREYEARYPGLIKPIYQTENQYSKGVKVTLEYQYSRVKGKYIALCEGDDYWTDPLKLQKQVDFLETHKEFVMCSHVVDSYIEDEHIQKKWGVQDAQEYNISTLIYGLWLFHPLSVVFRFNAIDVEKYHRYKSSKDMTLFYHLLSAGKGYYMSDNMAVYRKHSGGIWTSSSFTERMMSNYHYTKDLYDVEHSDLALAYMCEKCIGHLGRRTLLRFYSVSLGVLKIYTTHYGIKAGLSLFYNNFLLGKDLQPWRTE